MSQGHTIPLLSLSRLLRRRSAVVTIFTTSKNSPRIRASLQDVDVSILELPFPGNIDGVPPGVENTDRLPSMACFSPFAKSTKLMQKSFEQALETLRPPVSCIISDGFLGWTQKSAEKMGIPRLVFIGMGNYSCTMYQILGRDRPQADTHSPDEPFPIPDFPTVKLTRNDFDPPFNDLEPSGPVVEFMTEQLIATSMSRGVLVDSFYELESRYVDYWNKKIGPKAFNIGPLCMAAAPSSPPEALEKPSYMQWLDERLAKGNPFCMWRLDRKQKWQKSSCKKLLRVWSNPIGAVECLQKFEEKVKNRGMVLKEWVDQRGILRHGGVKGFLSHCGWNSVMESISAGVPLLALPLMAEQHMNARFVAEEIGVGLRIMPRGGTVRGFVEAEEVERVVREMMEGEKGVEVRRKAVEYGGAACAAMAEGGSSWRTLDLVVADVSDNYTPFPEVWCNYT
ncbi:UNVERIFIED_CONTAM: UDP-glycosyltransferase 90A1 [Sesamum angustifolium]|uniref:Glycosyltransferase n=1 Tax=Sesamum angustifolium TaxID=2727405 RepID=A0AAW2Q9Q8_9LAMI